MQKPDNYLYDFHISFTISLRHTSTHRGPVLMKLAPTVFRSHPNAQGTGGCSGIWRGSGCAGTVVACILRLELQGILYHGPLGQLIFSQKALMGDPIYAHFSIGFRANPIGKGRRLTVLGGFMKLDGCTSWSLKLMF